ncbi:uncharacterized protein FTOL_07861 [Fusarium torulosum]|uniref:Uncharacterized protein n=1 Tax=Fusarium torulosum TaxID=33205 RepID=A0AAE8MBQ5_9HYPO|nr:uncharacterized protein FTOL_07861 [Fusarium torulosum]
MCPRRRLGEDPEFDALTGLEPLFRAFVSKIAFLCCTEVGGEAISACAVLQLPDCIQYVIGFNQQNLTRRTKIQSGLASILSLFAALPPGDSVEREELRIQALQASLELCQGRVKGYLKSLEVHLQECIQACRREGSRNSESTQTEMSRILGVLELCFGMSQSESVDKSRTSVNSVAVCDLISSLSVFFRSHMFSDVRHRLSRENDMMSTTYWSDCVHVAGRLLSYKRAVDLMDLLANIWPQLFLNFRICMISSSSTESDILPANPWTAAKIFKGMSSDKEVLSRFAKQLDSFSVHDIDVNISEFWRHAPKPIVHAEILVHSWLENTEGGIRPERFFNRWKFIGTSKPPCKLCSYFFDEYPTDVQVRPSHQNVYFAWRMPDVFEHQGEASIRTRRLVMESIKTRIRADVVRILSEKISDGRPHDSSAYTALFPSASFGAPRNLFPAEATAQSPDAYTLSKRQEESPTTWKSDNEVGHVLDEDEEEVLLFRGRSAARKAVHNQS